MTPWTDLVEVHWGRGLEAYVTPVSDELVGIALLTTRREPFDVQFKEFPALVERLDRAEFVRAAPSRQSPRCIERVLRAGSQRYISPP